MSAVTLGSLSSFLASVGLGFLGFSFRWTKIPQIVVIQLVSFYMNDSMMVHMFYSLPRNA